VAHGAGGHAETVPATTDAEAKYEIMGPLDDDASKHRTPRCVTAVGVLAGIIERRAIKNDDKSPCVKARYYVG